jgi:hypothetical protein
MGIITGMAAGGDWRSMQSPCYLTQIPWSAMIYALFRLPGVQELHIIERTMWAAEC